MYFKYIERLITVDTVDNMEIQLENVQRLTAVGTLLTRKSYFLIISAVDTVDSVDITKLRKSLFLLRNTPCKSTTKPFLSCLDY